MFLIKGKPRSDGPLSKFIREAKAEDKKRLYAEVLRRASERQNEVVARVQTLKRSRQASG